MNPEWKELERQFWNHDEKYNARKNFLHYTIFPFIEKLEQENKQLQEKLEEIMKVYESCNCLTSDDYAEVRRVFDR